ncbi:hypothetical protein [Pseudooceanicola marinus]|uniref:hypothetical protein n=1 Tax=Pseudooceanicola marinus TaxID=396013 RepID=UPI001C967EFC|nr:hypothetical protein [Pseudooceanicola marinus]MBY5973635.1 hypothetical protein [Ferrimonas balearica]MCA1338202.1 hypothetical protein [Pseudooceanicola marinus]
MQPINASQQASALYRAHGPAAEAKVAEKIRACEASGETDQARDWQRIRDAIRELKH